MFTTFYHLRRRPFENTPDPAFLFLSSQHREVLYSLIYGIESAKGFILLAGDVGTGKTTLVRALLKEIGLRHRVIAIADPRVGFDDILDHLGRKLDLEGVSRQGLAGLERLATRLATLHGEGGRVVLLIDEAHLLTEETLEGIRILSNLEEERSKLLQIVLVGQNEIYPLLERGSQRSFKQRIVINRQLRPLTREETAGYIGHRLTAAGAGPGLFDRRAVAMIWRESGGTPRVINQLCDNALVTGYALDTRVIGTRIVREVLHDMGPLRPKASRPFLSLPFALWPRWSFATGLILLTLGLGVAGISSQEGGNPSPPEATPAVATARPDVATITRPGPQAPAAPPTPVAPVATPVEPRPASPPAVAAIEPPPPPSAPPTPAAPAVTAKATVAVPMEPVVPATGAAPPLAPAVVEEVGVEEVIIPPNFTLSSLASQRYGAATETVLDLIQTANEGLVDINLLRVGQTVRFPAITRESMVVRGDDGKFHIHYASFYAEDNARRVRERFVGQGLTSFFTPFRQGENQVFRVFVGSFDRREEAIEALKAIDFKNLPFLNQREG